MFKFPDKHAYNLLCTQTFQQYTFTYMPKYFDLKLYFEKDELAYMQIKF